MDERSEISVAESAGVETQAAAIAGERDRAGYETVAIDELTAHTWQFEGRRVQVSGRFMTVELTFDGHEYVLLDVPIPGDLAHSGDAAVAWDGDMTRLVPNQTLTVWGTVAGTHISGGRACGFTVSPLIRADRLEAR